METAEKEDTGLALDTLQNTVQLIYNEAGLPTYYFSDVFTPVCNSSDCLPIKIELRWDLDGNFFAYSMPGEEILTKTEHEPFTKADYAHLSRILNDSLSVLVDHTVYSLENSYAGQKEVDGVSGATSMMTAGTYVPGALYTSVRLWHLVYDIKPQLRKYTSEKVLSKFEPEKLVLRKDISASVVALEQWLKTTENAEQLLSNSMSMFDDHMVIKVLTFLESADYNNTLVAPSLMEHYKSSNEDLKLLIERIWKTVDLEADFMIKLVNTSLTSSGFVNITIDLLNNRKEWEDDLYHAVVDYCEKERNMNRRSRMKKVLLKRRNQFPRTVKSRIKKNGW